jgi:hypothetical protein
VIAVRIGHDHFAVWRIEAGLAAALVPGATPLLDAAGGWLLHAAVEFRSCRLLGLPAPGGLRSAAWLVPCQGRQGGLANALVRRCLDHPLLPPGLRLAGWSTTRIHIDGDGFRVAGGTWACARPGRPHHDLAWFKRDRGGLLPDGGGWRPWPIAKRHWGWRVRCADLGPTPWPAQAVGLVTVRPTVARWGRPRCVSIQRDASSGTGGP